MKAIILSRRNFRESDQIISCYTQEKGKLELLARGVKKITSKNSAHLEPFSCVDIDIAYGKEIDYVTTVHGVDYFSDIRNNLEKSLGAQYVVSLTDKLMKVGEVDERVFGLLRGWLRFVDEHDDFNIILVDCFIVLLLYCLGFSISSGKMHTPDPLNGQLAVLETGDYNKVLRLSLENKEYEMLHSFIYKFLLYHTEQKALDWAKTCII